MPHKSRHFLLLRKPLMRLLSLLLVLTSALSVAQITTAQEDSLKFLGKQVLFSKTEAERVNANASFYSQLRRSLKQPGAFEYRFDSVVTMARLYSPDKKFRLLNWNLRLDDGTYRYFCIIQTPTELIELKDKTTDIKSPETAVLDKEKWYGAHYYQIVQAGKRKKRYYLLLGWKGNDRLTTQKVIEVLSFNKKQEPVFGAKVFDYPDKEDRKADLFKKNKTRIIFEHSAEVSMSLRYHPEDDQIVFDHLSPRSSDLKGQYQYYGPDMSYDRFRRKRSRWIYEEDVDIRNKKTRTDELYKRP